MSRRPWSAAAKRGFDIAAAGVLFVVTLPVQAGVAVLIRRDMGSPVTFRQQRPGRDGEVFELVKFRTMRVSAPGEGVESDGSRLTPLGRKLRAASLDELPTLVNVIRGDMSLVGPRPLLVEYLDRYTPEQARRHEVRPGVTGLAQVQLPADSDLASVRAKVAHDLYYIDHASAGTDLRVLLATGLKVFGASFAWIRRCFRLPSPATVEHHYHKMQVAARPAQPAVELAPSK